jgi:hypothetical protein
MFLGDEMEKLTQEEEKKAEAMKHIISEVLDVLVKHDLTTIDSINLMLSLICALLSGGGVKSTKVDAFNNAVASMIGLMTQKKSIIKGVD